MSNPIKEEISRAEVACLNAPPVLVPDLSDEDRAFEDWRFLERFAVKFKANLAFFLDILRQHETQTHQSWIRDTRNGIVKIYELIADHYNEINRAMLM